jgi:hypothetical protein
LREMVKESVHCHFRDHFLGHKLRKHSEITVVFMGKSNSSIRHEIPRG